MRRAVLASVLVGLLVAGTVHAPRADDGEITVFGAASLTDALTTIAQRYEAETGAQVRLSFASSSTLARQIESGAPAHIYGSADELWMDYLEEKGLIAADTRTSPIGNRLVLIAPAGSATGEVTIDGNLDLAGLLGPDGRLAVGDPAHVPAGIYAQPALEFLGLWQETEPRLARAENVRSALALVELGETPLGIVYGTDAALSDKVRIVGVFPEESHEPVSYPFAIVAGAANQQVRELFAYITGEQGLAVFDEYGFSTR